MAARGASERAGFAEASETNARAVLNAGWNFGFHHTLAQHAALAFAFRARVGDHASCSLTGRAGSRDAEKTLLVAYLAAPLAGLALCRGLSRGGAGAMTILTGFVTTHIDAFLGSENRFIEFEGEVFAQVRAALSAIAAAPAPTEDFAEPEELSEDVGEILKDGWIESLCGRGVDAGVTEAVIERAFFAVNENGVGFGDFLEFFFRLGAVRIAVRVILHGQLAVGAFDFLLSGSADHS